MIETACQMTDNRVSGDVIAALIVAGKEMLAHPIELLPGVGGTIETLSSDFTLLLVTKGDLLDQERKLAQSGLGEMFDGVEIVSDKTAEVVAGIFTGRGSDESTSLMAGNSMKSDVLPAVEAGAWGVHVPFGKGWDLEAADAPIGHPRFREIQSLSELPDLIATVKDNI